jgi:hypothetical protein
MEWFRWYGGTLTDPKFQWVANKSCQTVAAVIAVWVAVLERAHDCEQRGCCTGLDFESLDVALHLDDGAAHDIYQAFVRKAMIVDGDMVANWERRQPKREDETAAERKKDYRDRIKLQKENEDLQKQLDVLKSHNVPQCPTMSHEVTTEERRLEERREKTKISAATHARVREVLTAVMEEKRAVLVEKFPQCDHGVVLEKLIALCEPKGLPVDPWLTMLRFWQREFPNARGRPENGVVEKKTKGEQRQDAVLANAQEALRILEGGDAGEKQALDKGADGVAGYSGGGPVDHGAVVVVCQASGRC